MGTFKHMMTLVNVTVALETQPPEKLVMCFKLNCFNRSPRTNTVYFHGQICHDDINASSCDVSNIICT